MLIGLCHHACEGIELVEPVSPSHRGFQILPEVALVAQLIGHQQGDFLSPHAGEILEVEPWVTPSA
jgi:hypothetical protein